jgi:ketosteroid isomerase-like protein
METIAELEEAWITAELHGDAAALDGLLADDFRAVGPLGFVLDKSQWLDRFRSGALRYDDVDWGDVEVRTYGDTAVAIGRWTQRGEHQGNSVDGTFRVTQVLVHEKRDWFLGTLQLSPMVTPG